MAVARNERDLLLVSFTLWPNPYPLHLRAFFDHTYYDGSGADGLYNAD